MNRGRLQLARAAAGLSLRGLEARVGGRVTAQAIGEYERGGSMPGSAALMVLAGALDVSLRFLFGGDDPVVEGVGSQQGRLPGRETEARVRVAVLERVEGYLVVEELLGLGSVAWDRPLGAPYPVGDGVGAELAAQMLRGAWGVGVDPIASVVELLEGRGVKVVRVDVEGMDGLSVQVRRSGHPLVPVMVVNPRLGGERQRGVLARELGRLVMDVAPGVDMEDAAWCFAGAFLCPAEVLWAEVGKRRTDMSVGELLRLTGLFGVSVEVLVRRSRDLGVIGETLYRRLVGEVSRSGWGSLGCEEAAPAERGTRLERLCMRAFSEEVISWSRAAEVLGMSVRVLEERMYGLGAEAEGGGDDGGGEGAVEEEEGAGYGGA